MNSKKAKLTKAKSKSKKAATSDCEELPNPHEVCADGIAPIRYYAMTGTGIVDAVAPKSQQLDNGEVTSWTLVLKPKSVATVLDVRTSNFTHDMDDVYPTTDFIDFWAEGRKACGPSYNPDWIAPGYSSRPPTVLYSGSFPVFIFTYLQEDKGSCSVVGDVTKNRTQEERGHCF